MNLNDWRKAISYNNLSQSTYRVGNSTLRFQTKFVLGLVACAVFVLFYVVSLPRNELRAEGSPILPNDDSIYLEGVGVGGKRKSLLFSSNPNRDKLEALLNNVGDSASGGGGAETIYPLTKPVQTERGLKYRIGIISDLDTESKTASGKWISYFRRGNLFLQYNKEDPKSSKATLEWDSGEPIVIKSGMNLNDRGMELSDLFVFNGKLYTCDDRTGIIYQLIHNEENTDEMSPIPWVILADGNGTSPKGFKCEWGCVKDGNLYIGGLGKEWTTNTGEIVNFDPQYVKKISSKGEVTHMNWKNVYNKLAQSLNIHFPGYVIHESGGWSPILKKWIFLPRRASFEQYNEKTDERKGTNILLIADETFSDIEVRHVGEVNPSHGFSSFKLIPGTDDNLILALKSEEVEGKTSSYIMGFDLQGNFILPEVKVGDHKYEGVEFI